MAAQAKYDHNVLLKNLVPLNALSEEHLDQLISRITIERAGSGDFIFREGDTDRQHVYLLEGRAMLLSGSREVDLVQSGTKIARYALAHQWPRKFSAQAIGDVRFVRIESRFISDLLVRTQSQSYRVSELDGEADGNWMAQVLRSRVMQQIPPSNIQNVLRRMEELNVSAGEVVIRQGDVGDYYYAIVRGSCIVSRSLDGADQQMAVFGPGDCFGEEALVSGGVRNASVSMATDGTLMRLGKEDFAELIRSPLLRSVTMEVARTLVEKGASWIDVRPRKDYAAGHLPGAQSLPLDVLHERCAECALTGTYVVYGENFNDGAVGAFQLRERGLDVWVLEGGITAQEAETSVDTDRTTPDVEPEILAKPPVEVPGDQAQQAREIQARYQKALLQRIEEIRELRRMLEAATADRQRLEQALQQARDENAVLRSGARGGEEQEQLKKRIAKLQQELDDVQEIIQDASAQESSSNWERLRLQAKLESTERDLAEQRDINRVLREENEETTRRLDTLGRELSQLHAKHGDS
jgi:CRP-like cAMP-binding protein